MECKKNFAKFWIKIRAYGGIKGFQNALKPKRETNLPEMEEDEVERHSEACKARERNLAAMTYLSYLFSTELNINMIARAQWFGIFSGEESS